MENKKLYPELVDYIFDYCQGYLSDKERIANKHLFALAKSKGNMDNPLYQFFMKGVKVNIDEEVTALIEGDFVKFKERVTQRIFKNYKDELVLNLCPKCGKIARTPRAKQCRFCFHDWH